MVQRDPSRHQEVPQTKDGKTNNEIGSGQHKVNATSDSMGAQAPVQQGPLRRRPRAVREGGEGGRADGRGGTKDQHVKLVMNAPGAAAGELPRTAAGGASQAGELGGMDAVAASAFRGTRTRSIKGLASDSGGLAEVPRPTAGGAGAGLSCTGPMVDGMDVSGPAAAVRKHAEMIVNQALEAFMSAKRIWRDLMAARRVIWGKRFDLQVELSDMKCSRRRRIELDQELFANDELLEAADSNVARALAQTEGACDEACALLQALLLTADSDVLIDAVIVLLEVLAAQGSRRMDELRRALATALALFETAQALIVSNAGGVLADRSALLERFREGDVTSDRADEVGQIVQFVDSKTAMVGDGDLVFGDDVLLAAWMHEYWSRALRTATRVL